MCIGSVLVVSKLKIRQYVQKTNSPNFPVILYSNSTLDALEILNHVRVAFMQEIAQSKSSTILYAYLKRD